MAMRYNKIFKHSLIAYLLGTLSAYAFLNISLMLASLGVGIFICVRYFEIHQLKQSGEKKITIFLAASIIPPILLSPISAYKSPESLYFIFSSCVAILIAFLSGQRLADALSALRITLVIVLLILFFYIINNYSENPFPLEDFLQGAGSSNVVTSFLVVLQVAYSAITFIHSSKITWMTPLATFAICIVGYGRGSILASLMLLLTLMLIHTFRMRRSIKNTIFIGISVLILCLLSSIYYTDVLSVIANNSKLGLGLVDDSRLMMINDYLAKLDGASLLLGSSYLGTSIEILFGNNPHNSFIRAHHMMGAFYLLFILSLPIFSILIQRNWLMFFSSIAFFVIIIFRAFSEPILFPTPIDYYFYIIIFCLVKKTSERSKNHISNAKFSYNIKG